MYIQMSNQIYIIHYANLEVYEIMLNFSKFLNVLNHYMYT